MLSPIYSECGCEQAVRQVSDQAAAKLFFKFMLGHEQHVRSAGGHHGDLISNECCYWSVHGPDGRHVIGVR